MSVSESEKECPLCMETLDWDDLGFFPCSCGYQICRFCWHRLRTDENGLCPACRQAFPDIPVSFNPEISAEELKKQKRRNKERRSNKDQVFKPQDLATLRVVQKNLVFVIGLSSRLTQEDLKKEFAQFGRIIKFVHNKSTAYITYSKPEEAIRAIRTLNASAAHEQQLQQLQSQQLTNGTSTTPAIAPTTTTATSITNNNLPNTAINANSVTNLNSINSFTNAMSVPVPPSRLKASLGTTKYCNHFLRSQQCPKVGECMYLHEIAEAEASFTKEQMQAGKHVEYEKKLMDSYLAKLEWQNNLAPQTNGYSRVNHTNGLPIQSINPHLTLAQQISSQLSATQLSPSSNNNNNQSISFGHRSQSSITTNGTNSNNNINNNNNSTTVTISATGPVAATTTKITASSAALVNQPVINDHQNSNNEFGDPSPSLLISQQQQPLTSHSRQQEHQLQQQLVLDSDSDDDGLDFDPISVSTRGLRDLLDQQVQQAKQLQMQNYFQQLNPEQSLASVIFQQNNRLNHNSQGSNGLIDELTSSSFNGHPQTIPSLAGLSNSANQQQQVAWQNMSAWTNFLQRSGFGFENSR